MVEPASGFPSSALTCIFVGMKLTPAERQYLETALWSSTDPDGNPLDREFSVDDFSKSAQLQARNELERFLTQAEEPILVFSDKMEELGKRLEFDDSDIAHDFWLTRNGHGVGFWDRPEKYGEDLAEILSELAAGAGERSVEPSEDGMLEFEPNQRSLDLSHPKFSGDVVPFAFADRVGKLLEENGFRRDRSFEPPADESAMSKKWQRSGQYTKLIVRIHQWSPELAEFYLEGGPGAFIIGGNGRLLETAKANAGDLQTVLAEMMRIQDLREGARAEKGKLGPRRLDGTNDIIKKCSCGRTYTEAQWKKLKKIGEQKTEADEFGPAELLELRNCPCTSTLAIEIQP